MIEHQDIVRHQINAEKPWTEGRKVQLNSRYRELVLEKTLLESKLLMVTDEMVVVRSAIVDGLTSEPVVTLDK